MQSSPVTYHSPPPPPGPNIPLNTLFSNILSLCSYFSGRDQVLHPKTAGKIVMLYVLIFKFTENRQEERSSEQNGGKPSLNLMCS
jgi:hypothetical protein